MKYVCAALSLAGLVALSSNAWAEPVEYVRICDTYGKEFVYSPGTEKCVNLQTGETKEDKDGHIEKGVVDAIEGSAVSLALQPAFVEPGKSFGAAVNVGTFGGATALGFSGAVRITDGLTVNGGVGVGLTNGTVGGRAGANFSW